MLDSRLVQGLLIVACVSLLFAIVMTWVDINRHQAPGVAAAAPAEQPAEPAEQPPAEQPPAGQPPGQEPEAEQPQALRNAPQGTWGFFSLDVRRLLKSPMLKEQRQQMQQQLPAGASAEDVRRMSFFLFPKQGEKPGWGGALTFDPGARAQIESGIKKNGEAVTVAGTTAYKITRQASGAPGMGSGAVPFGGPQSAFVALADDETALMGGSEADLTTMLETYGSGGGASPGLAKLANRFSGAALSGAALVPDNMIQKLQQQAAGQQAQLARGLRGGAMSVNLERDLDLKALIRFARASQARQAVQKMQSQIDAMKRQAQASPQTQRMMGPMVGVLDKLTFSAQGTDLNLSANLTKEDLKALAFPAMMMMGGMGGGRGQMPMGPSQAPPSR